MASKQVDTIVGVSQLIERGDKLRLRSEVGRALVDAAERGRDDAERTQRYELLQAYYELAHAQEKALLSGETAALLTRALQVAERRQKAGDIASIDVTRMQVETLRAENEVRAALAELRNAQTSLGYMIGRERDVDRLRTADPLPPLQPEQPTWSVDAVGHWVEARPDVRAAAARVAATDRARELARSLRTRDVTAGVQFERYPGTEPRSSLGFTISVPLFLNHSHEGEILRAEADWMAAQDQLARVRALAVADITRATNDLAAAQERLGRYRTRLLPAAEKSAQGAEFAYSRGATGVMDAIDARRQLAATRLEALAAHLDYAKALAAWQAARGTPN